jgi:hypothetical protein
MSYLRERECVHRQGKREEEEGRRRGSVPYL